MAPVSNNIQMPDSVTSLTDDQLRSALLARGLNPGPIVTSTRHLYRKKLAQFMLREEQVEGFDEQVDGFNNKEEMAEEEEEDDFQPSAITQPSPNPSLRSRTLRKAETEEKVMEVSNYNNDKQQQPTNSSVFSKLCELLIFAFKLLVFLVILGAGFLMYTATISSTSEGGDLPLSSAPEKNLA